MVKQLHFATRIPRHVQPVGRPCCTWMHYAMRDVKDMGQQMGYHSLLFSPGLWPWEVWDLFLNAFWWWWWYRIWYTVLNEIRENARHKYMHYSLQNSKNTWVLLNHLSCMWLNQNMWSTGKNTSNWSEWWIPIKVHQYCNYGTRPDFDRN